MALIDAAYFKSNFLGVSDVNADRDARIAVLISRASKEFRHYCNQPLEEETNTLRWVGDDTSWKLLPYRWVSAVGTVQRRLYPGDSFVNIDNTTALDALGAMSRLYIHNGTYEHGYTYQVNVTSGYASGAIPDDLKHLCGERVYELFLASPDSQGAARRFAVSAVTTGNESGSRTVTYRDLSNYFKEKLAAYRMVPV